MLLSQEPNLDRTSRDTLVKKCLARPGAHAPKHDGISDGDFGFDVPLTVSCIWVERALLHRPAECDVIHRTDKDTPIRRDPIKINRVGDTPAILTVTHEIGEVPSCSRHADIQQSSFLRRITKLVLATVRTC